MNNPNMYIPKQKNDRVKAVELKIIDYIFYIAFGALSLSIVFTGFFAEMATGFAVSSLLLVITMTAYLIRKDKISSLSVTSVILASLNCVVFFLYYDDVFTQLISFGLLTVSGILYTMSMCDKTVLDSATGVLKLIYGAVISPIEHIAVPVRSLLKNSKKKTIFEVLLALVTAVPVLVVIVPLLVSSDVAFEGLVSKIFSSIGLTVVKIAISIVLFALISSYAVSCKFGLINNIKPIDISRARCIKAPFAITFLGVISFVYLVYMFSQTAYFFSAFSGILPEGYEFSFAEYARKGFFETEAIAFINLVIMTLVLWLSHRRENGKLNGATKGLLTFISAFTVLFIVTAMSKMVMYIGEYGLTHLRLFTSVFMLSTATFVIAFAVRLFNPEIKSMKYAVLVSMALFTALCLSGLDRTVASYNVNAYLSGRHDKIDMETLSYLSDSATPYLVKLTKCDDESVKEKAEYAVSRDYDYYENRENQAERDVIYYSSPKGADFTLSKYLQAKAVNEAQIKYQPHECYNVDEDIDTPEIEDETVDLDDYQ